jgi:hypothetical protein
MSVKSSPEIYIKSHNHLPRSLPCNQFRNAGVHEAQLTPGFGIPTQVQYWQVTRACGPVTVNSVTPAQLARLELNSAQLTNHSVVAGRAILVRAFLNETNIK